MTYIKR